MLTTTAGRWTLSDSHTLVTFNVRSLGGRLAHGSVACTSGEVEVDPTGTPVRARAELDLGSLDTGITRRDADLRKARFLDIDRHPTMRWSAEHFTPAGDGAWRAEGVLSVRGTTAVLAVVASPELDAEGLRIRGSAVLDRTAVGIRAPRFLIGRLVRIDVDARLTSAG
jgi:polyisoprenoid-binding protein YceI